MILQVAKRIANIHLTRRKQVAKPAPSAEQQGWSANIRFDLAAQITER